jgi:hypothetical protein
MLRSSCVQFICGRQLVQRDLWDLRRGGRIVTTGADDVANNDDYNLIMYKVNPGFL